MKKFLLPIVFGLLLSMPEIHGQDTEPIKNTPSISITPVQDSMLNYLIKNREPVEFMVDGYNKFKIGWGQLATTIFVIFGLLVLTWKLWAEEKLMDVIKRKAQETVENWASLKGVNILVLTSSDGNEDFLRSFFKEKKFSSVRYARVGAKYQPIDDYAYELVFINNDDGKINQDIARQYYQADCIFFYFGKERWDSTKDEPELNRNMNMANARAQIYGNLMSSLEFLQLTKPKYKNV